MASRTTARIPFIIAIIAMAALVAWLNQPAPAKKAKRVAKPTTVVTNEVKQAPFRDIIEAIGTANANEQVSVFPRYAGMVKTVPFSDGQLVKKGQLLATLHSEQEQAEVKALAANLAEAQSQLTRLMDLRRTNATSQSQLEEQQAKTSAIDARLEKAKARLAEFDITASFDGVLGLRLISPGAFISTSDKITSLDDISIIKVDFTVPERYLTTVAIGQTIEASSIAYHNESFSGQISSINSRLDPVTRAVKIRAQIDNTDMRLHPGMLLNILLERSVENTIMINESAIIPIEDKHYVYTAKHSKAQRIEVQIGRRRPGQVEVLSGLSSGQQVVVEGAIKLSDGAAIKIKGPQA
ncbi:MAG: membrane fusion protein (multidrug efflux system) [Phenylobacterium sp.]|jgi:membrane fusion protein (multidrug efflux system)